MTCVVQTLERIGNILKIVCLCVSESSCPDIQMGFCMETTGMTQGDQGESHCDLEIEGDSVEESTFKDETESMEDEQDPEVSNSTGLCVKVYCCQVQLIQLTL